MTWYAWAIVGLTAAGTALNILAIGRPRPPLTPAAALGIVIANGLVVWGVIALAT